MIVIIGAGLAGLSIAARLTPGTYRIFEHEATPGGLCRSEYVDGFTFDRTGHLLHLDGSLVTRHIGKLLSGNLMRIKRNAAVYLHGRYVPYPFQAHLFGLPRTIIRACLFGFLNAPARFSQDLRCRNFKEWVFAHFGPGMARHFFIPYNEKLWLRDVRLLSSSWASWAVPVPSVHEVLRGSLGIVNSGLGYNASFFYPVRGGIQVLCDAFARSIPHIETGCTVRSVNLSRHTITLQDGRTLGYNRLVSTAALPNLFAMLEDAPPALHRAAQKLAWVTVYNINIGINRQRLTEYHWIYFPEPDVPFYRVGCYSNLTPFMAPSGTSSLYLEIALQPGEPANFGRLFESSIDALYRCGILRRGDRIVARQDYIIPCGYVVFDRWRDRTLPRLMSFLHQHDVFPSGRYGMWTYASMQDVLKQAVRIARMLSRRPTSKCS